MPRTVAREREFGCVSDMAGGMVLGRCEVRKLLEVLGTEAVNISRVLMDPSSLP